MTDSYVYENGSWRDKTRNKESVRYFTVNGVYSIPKDLVQGVIIKIVPIPYSYNPSGKIKGKIAILRSIFKQIVGVNIFRKNDNKSFDYILYKDTELEMKDNKVVCVNYKGKGVAKTVNESLIFKWKKNKEFKKLWKLAARKSLINSKMKLHEKMLKKL